MFSSTALVIKDLINGIDNKEYLLPSIQREFVWTSEQIEILFDSLMREYPINTFLFWEVKKENINQFHFYEFLKKYHEKNSTHNSRATGIGNKDIIAVLDGQQRMTSLYIALKGSYTEKAPRKRENSPNAYPEKKMYLNLLRKAESEGIEYDFRFLSKEELESMSNEIIDVYHNEGTREEKKYFWFDVSQIINMNKINESLQFVIKNGLTDTSSFSVETTDFVTDTITKLYTVINETPTIPFHLEKASDINKILQIFIRTNSGGTKLSYSDLLLSIASAEWKDKEAKEVIMEFVDSINDIGKGFKFNKDFVLKSCLVLSDFKDIGYKIDNFSKENMSTIETNWDKIAEAIRLSIHLISNFGYNGDTLTTTNAVIPIAYYIYKHKLTDSYLTQSKYEQDRTNVKQWLIRVILKKIFGGQPDSLYPPLRDIINKYSYGFPLKEIIDESKGKSKTLVFTMDDLETITNAKYGNAYTFSALSLLYPSLDFKNIFHQDHIFPKSKMTAREYKKHSLSNDMIKYYNENYNLLPNIQLLDSAVNQSKSATHFDIWMNKTYSNAADINHYKTRHYIPKNIDLDFKNFKEFFETRKQQLIKAFKDILGV